MKHKNYGFTIIELLIVIVVVAIVAGISVVAYRGFQARAQESSISSSLAQAKKKLELYKVDHGSYPPTGHFSDIDIANTAVTVQYSSTDGAAYCLSGIAGNTVYHLTNSTTKLTAGGCIDQMWPGGVRLTNLVVNGDFSQGATGCSASRCTASVVDGYGQFVGIGGHENYEMLTSVTSPSIIGHVYYTRFDIRTVNGAPSFLMRYYGQTAVVPNITQQNVWLTRSGRATAGVGNTTHYIRVSWGNGENQAGKITHLDNVVTIDLTESFGAGNEPTTAQMDAIMEKIPNRYFAGSVTVDPR